MIVRVLLIGVSVALALVPVPPDRVEQLYSNGAYPVVQQVLTRLSNLVPWALFDVLLAGFAAWWISMAVRTARRVRPGGRVPRAIRIAGVVAMRTATGAAVIYLVFLLVWGLNYRRLALEERLALDRSAATPAAARSLARRAVEQLNALYEDAHDELRPGSRRIEDENGALAEAFSRAQGAIGVRRPAWPARPKRTLIDPYFRATGVEGMTDPFFLETLVAGGLLPVERPSVVAHEWSHLAGFADEGEANFVGWLTCIRGSAAARYSGWLFLYRELVNALGAQDGAELSKLLAEGPRRDLTAIAERMRREVRPALSAAGWRVYDSYLKAQHVEAGAESYGQVVRLVLGAQDRGLF
jgi:hypothetical protein